MPKEIKVKSLNELMEKAGNKPIHFEIIAPESDKFTQPVKYITFNWWQLAFLIVVTFSCAMIIGFVISR